MLFVGGILGDVDAAGALGGCEGDAALGVVRVAHTVKGGIAVHKALEKSGLVGGEPVKGGAEVGKTLEAACTERQEFIHGDLFTLAVAAVDLEIAVALTPGGAAAKHDAGLHAAVFQGDRACAGGNDFAADGDGDRVTVRRHDLCALRRDVFHHIIKQIAIGVAVLVIAGIDAVGVQVQEHAVSRYGFLIRADGSGDRILRAVDERCAVGADLPCLQPGHAALDPGGRQQLQTAVVVEVRDGIVPGVPVVLLFEIGEAAREEFDLLADAVCYFMIVIMLVRVGDNTQREQHAQREYDCEKLFHIFFSFPLP